MRVICWLFGCDGRAGYCRRCGSELYDPAYYAGPLVVVAWLRELLAAFVVVHRCDVCRKRFWATDKYESTCSSKCRDEWILF